MGMGRLWDGAGDGQGPGPEDQSRLEWRPGRLKKLG